VGAGSKPAPFAYKQLQLLPASAFGRPQPTLCMRLRQALKDVLYAVALPAGTKIRRSEWVFRNTLDPNPGDVALSKVTLVKLVQPLNT
jgi:hypothetical protein